MARSIACPDARRVGLLSDTHGVLDPSVAEVMATCDLVLHAGDIGGAGVLDALGESGATVCAVLGNNDVPAKWPSADLARLDTLAEGVTLSLPGGELAMEHGHRVYDTRHYHRRLRERHPAARVVVYGHTHVRRIDTGQTPWVLNPGAAGRERTHGGASCLVIDTTADDWSIAEYCFPRARARG